MEFDYDNLSKRELEILHLISEYYKNSEISEKLILSHHTVETHKTNLVKKLKLKNTTELTAFAILFKEHITIQLQKITANRDKTKNNNGGGDIEETAIF
ncbi:MAG TPA: helix-turn-helix transcriptional regulator [Ignavibacteriaceae bacterium]|nr:helix-turn-helix transcriptional regulator [Ignavibacteriaceae bacterium]HRP92156.1 helix-turn-helix transcriptional regulator [Ignavibacteriaceae bacterium]HRQ53123.1 helix-turn-helix transcriptional regulator [Ignavibacteriaceae bacterium]